MGLEGCESNLTQMKGPEITNENATDFEPTVAGKSPFSYPFDMTSAVFLQSNKV